MVLNYAILIYLIRKLKNCKNLEVNVHKRNYVTFSQSLTGKWLAKYSNYETMYQHKL